MQLMEWNAFRDMEDLFTRVQRNFGRPVLTEGEGDLQVQKWSPAVDIVEKDKEYLFKAELPGVKKDDVKIIFENGVLTLQGERKVEKEEKTDKYFRTERAYGTFFRSFALPDDAAPDKITADFKDGVIYIRIGRTATKKAKAIEVQIH